MNKIMSGTTDRYGVLLENKYLILMKFSSLKAISSRVISGGLLLISPFLILFLLIAGCASTTTHVVPIGEVDKPGRGGMVYTLPMTALDLEIPITRVVTKAPTNTEYSKWTEKLFGKKPLPSSIKISVGVPIIKTVGIPDPKKIYYAEIIAGPFSDSRMSLTFDNRGILSAANLENQNKTSDFIVSTLETAGKIAGSMAMFISVTETEKKKDVEEEMKKAEAYNAIMAFQRIKRANELRENILTTPDVGDLSSRLKEVDSSLQEDMTLFFGEKKTEIWKSRFLIIPDSGNEDYPIFKYDQKKGIQKFNVEPRNKERFKYEEKSQGTNVNPSIRMVKVNITASPIINIEQSEKIFANKKRGLHYNIPAPGVVTVYDGSSKLLKADYSFGQFGPVGFLPCSTGSRTLHQEITLDSTTGVLLSVKNISNAFDPQAINKVGTAVSDAIGAYDPKVEAERARDIAKALYEKLDYEKKAEALEAGITIPEEE